MTALPRRAVLAAVAAPAPLLPLPPRAAQASDADAALMICCARATGADGAASQLRMHLQPGEETPVIRAELARLARQARALVERTCATPAATPAGLRAKAGLIAHLWDRHRDGAPVLATSQDRRIWLLLEHLLYERAPRPAELRARVAPIRRAWGRGDDGAPMLVGSLDRLIWSLLEDLARGAAA